MVTFVRTTALFISLAVTGCNRLATQTEILDLANSNSAQASLKVNDDRCDLRIPLTRNQQRWTWGTSTGNVCEYSIQVSIVIGTRKYELGYSNFNGSSIPSRGSLNELISAGQNSVWRVSGDSGENIGSMNGNVNGNNLELSLEDPQLMDEIFGERPEMATLVTGGMMLLPHRIPLRIEYTQLERR